MAYISANMLVIDHYKIHLLNLLYLCFLKDCIRALDGTHIQCKTGNATRQCYRNRKGQNSGDILCVVSSDMMFTYVNVGWEQSLISLMLNQVL